LKSSIALALRVRPYRDGDAAAIRDCIAELQDSERELDDRLRTGASIAAPYFEHMHDRCRECAGTILVAECDGDVAGFATVLGRVAFTSLDDPPGDYALVSDLVVRAPFRRRGLGQALLREAERLARTLGFARELRISVLSENHGARELYRAAGFSPYLETLSKRL
jgi:GNAT superfamily N-acetyltransferase